VVSDGGNAERCASNYLPLSALLGRPLGDLLTEAESTTTGPVFLAYLTAERTPHGESDIRGAFIGLSETTTHGSPLRAVVEAIALTFADAVDAFDKADTVPGTLLAIGGGARRGFVLRTITNATGCITGRSQSAEAGPAFDSARMAMAAFEGASAIEAVPPDQIAIWFTPNTSVDESMQTSLATFRALYPALKSIQ